MREEGSEVSQNAFRFNPRKSTKSKRRGSRHFTPTREQVVEARKRLRRFMKRCGVVYAENIKQAWHELTRLFRDRKGLGATPKEQNITLRKAFDGMLGNREILFDEAVVGLTLQYKPLATIRPSMPKSARARKGLAA